MPFLSNDLSHSNSNRIIALFENKSDAFSNDKKQPVLFFSSLCVKFAVFVNLKILQILFSILKMNSNFNVHPQNKVNVQ